MTQKFEQVLFHHIPRAENELADRLSQLATTHYDHLPAGVYVETIDRPSHSRETVFTTAKGPEDWRTHMVKYLTDGTLLEDKTEARKIRNRCFRLCMIQGELYKKSLEGPL